MTGNTEAVDDRPGAASPFTRPRRSRWPRIDWWSVLAVVAGGFGGGLVRYAVDVHWPTPPAAFPWATWTVNTAGAFALALTLVLVIEVLPPTRYVRALLGTGFLGALTTFGSVVTSVDRLVADGHAGLAAGYVGASVGAGLAAGWVGVISGRAFAAHRQKGRD